MAKRINMELNVKDKGTPVIKKFGDATRKQMTAIAGVVGAGALVAGFTSLIKKTIDYGDKLNKLNIQLGITATQLDKLKRVGEFAGVTMEQITTSIRIMARNLNDAADDTGLAKDALKELGVEAQDLLAMNPDKAFVKIAEALSKVENPTKRAALSMEVFGRSGAVVIQMAKDLDTNLAQMNTNWDDDKAQQAADFNDQMTEFMNIAKDLAIDVLPTVVSLMKNLGETVKWLKSVFGDTNKEWATADERVVKLTGTLTKLLARQVELERASRGKYGEKFTGQLESTKKAIDRTTKALGELSQKRREEAAVRKQIEAEKGVPITDTRVKPFKSGLEVIDLTPFIEAAKEAAEETERVLNEARAAGILEQARMAEEALNAETELMNAQIEKEKAAEAELTKTLVEEWKERQAAVMEYAQVFTNNMGDAFGDFADGTKNLSDSFSDMISSLASDLQRLLISQAFQKFAELFVGSSTGGSPAAGGTGGFLGSILGAFGYAGGGSVSKGRPVMVGERGPELFVPAGSGRIEPNVGGGSVQNNISVNVTQGQGNQTEADNQRFGKIIAEQIKDQVKSVMIDEQRYGGILRGRGF